VAFQPFYTFRQDTRPFGNGSPVAYRYVKSVFDADALGEIVQGELVAWDSANRRVIRYVRTGTSKLIGVARDSAAGMKKLGNQPGLDLTELSVWTTGIHELLGTAGETYLHGDSVFMSGTDTTKVTKVAAGGVQVGIVQNPQHVTLTGAVRVPILIDNYTETQA
jgi:hypothetical protein